MILGLILGLSILFLVLIGLLIPKIWKSNGELKGEMIAILCFLASIIILSNIFSFTTYIDDSGVTIDSFNVNETYVEYHMSDGIGKYVIVAYNRGEITMSEQFNRVFGDYRTADILEIRQDALGAKAVFVS